MLALKRVPNEQETHGSIRQLIETRVLKIYTVLLGELKLEKHTQNKTLFPASLQDLKQKI